nr:protein NRT1/ PTR FAMILY 4.6-like [Ipomoea batatas]
MPRPIESRRAWLALYNAISVIKVVHADLNAARIITEFSSRRSLLCVLGGPSSSMVHITPGYTMPRLGSGEPACPGVISVALILFVSNLSSKIDANLSMRQPLDSKGLPCVNGVSIGFYVRGYIVFPYPFISGMVNRSVSFSPFSSTWGVILKVPRLLYSSRTRYKEVVESQPPTWKGYVDWRNRPALRGKHGGMFAASFVLGVEVLENLAFLANASNLVRYLTAYMHFPLAKSANAVTNFMGTAFFLALLGGFLSDAFFTTYHIYLISALVEFLVANFLAFTISRQHLKWQ